MSAVKEWQSVSKIATTIMVLTHVPAVLAMNLQMMDSIVLVNSITTKLIFMKEKSIITLLNYCHCGADVIECTEGTHQCQQTCQNTIGSYTCGCNGGFTINNDGRSCNGKNFSSHINLSWLSWFVCVDVDECSDGVDTCDQVCINTAGSYYCNCSVGYRLLSDSTICQSKFIW